VGVFVVSVVSEDGCRGFTRGTWQLGIESDPVVVGGFWTAERRQAVVELVLDILRGWRPTGLPPVMAVVTRLAPVFRSWPTTYRWRERSPWGTSPP
jgi:hypothetical protein